MHLKRIALPAAILFGAIILSGGFLLTRTLLASSNAPESIAWSQNAGNGTVFPACGSATELLATCNNHTLTLSWGPPDPSAGGYASYYVASMTDNVSGYVWQPADVGDVTSYSVSGLYGTSYSWWIEACDSSGCSAPVYGNNFSCSSTPPARLCRFDRKCLHIGREFLRHDRDRHDPMRRHLLGFGAVQYRMPVSECGFALFTDTELSPGAGVSVQPGATISYRMNFANTSSVAQTNMEIIAPIPQYAQESSQGGGTDTNSGGVQQGELWWKDATLPASGSGSVDYSVIVSANAPDGSQLCNGPSIWSDQVASQGSSPGAVCNPVSNPAPPATCQDPAATNDGQPLPCTYPPTTCQDTTAANYGQPLPCTYAGTCQDTSATNYGQALPCTYAVCPDGTAPATPGVLSSCTCLQDNPNDPSACPATPTGTIDPTTCNLAAGASASCDVAVEWTASDTQDNEIDITQIGPGSADQSWSGLQENSGPAPLLAPVYQPGQYTYKLYDHGATEPLDSETVTVTQQTSSTCTDGTAPAGSDGACTCEQENPGNANACATVGSPGGGGGCSSPNNCQLPSGNKTCAMAAAPIPGTNEFLIGWVSDCDPAAGTSGNSECNPFGVQIEAGPGTITDNADGLQWNVSPSSVGSPLTVTPPSGSSVTYTFSGQFGESLFGFLSWPGGTYSCNVPIESQTVCPSGSTLVDGSCQINSCQQTGYPRCADATHFEYLDSSCTPTPESCVAQLGPGALCTGSPGEAYCTLPPLPQISFSVSPTLVKQGTPVTISWSSTGANTEPVSCTVQGSDTESFSGAGTKAPFQTIGIQSQTTFTLTCFGTETKRQVTVQPPSRIVSLVPAFEEK